jgi:hypothetical protein
VEQAEALREAASKLAWVAEVADLPDDQVSTVIGGGVRVDEYRRFVSVLAEELDAVAARAAMQPTLDADSTRHALAWATRLLEILGSDSVEALDSSADTR